MKKDKEIYGIIYKIINKVNNKVYIGQTIRKGGFNGRYSSQGKGIERVYNHLLKNINGKTFKSFNYFLFKDIKQYGFDNFDVDEKFDITYTKEELNRKEKEYIKKYKSNKKGYNRTIGGSNIKGKKKLLKVKSILNYKTLINYVEIMAYKKLFKEEQKRFKDYLIKNTDIKPDHNIIGLSLINGYFKQNNLPYIIESERENIRNSKNFRKTYWMIYIISSHT